MTDLEAALVEISEALEACNIPYILIGGLAVAAWGEARSTVDVDISVWTNALADSVECLCRRMHPLPKGSSTIRRALPSLAARILDRRSCGRGLWRTRHPGGSGSARRCEADRGPHDSGRIDRRSDSHEADLRA